MSRHLPPRVLRIAGPTPLVRRLSVQSVLSAFGDGVFLTGSAVFFTQIVGLSAAQVGLGLTIAGAMTFFLAVPLGKLSDRYGAKRVWATSSLVEALLYLVWLVVGSMATFVAMLVVLELVVTASRSARNAYRFDVFPREERVSSSARLAGVALATNRDSVIRTVPVATAVLLLLNATLVSRLPRVAHHVETDSPLEAAAHAHDGGSALRNRGYVLMSIFDGV